MPRMASIFPTAKSARYDKSAQVISWESAAERIGPAFCRTDSFATNVELTEAAGYERSLLAEKNFGICTTISAIKPEIPGICPVCPVFRGPGFPEETAWLAEQLNRPEFRQTLAEEYAAFWTAYQQDRELLRFHYHKPERFGKT